MILLKHYLNNLLSILTYYLHSEPQNCNEGDVRLLNGTVEMEGRLEVCTGGIWGTVCAHGFPRSAAYVACKQLGHDDTNGMCLYTHVVVSSSIFVVLTNTLYSKVYLIQKLLNDSKMNSW